MYYGWSTLKKLIYLRPRLGGTPSESVTVTGISPLLLESALRKALQSLIQDGVIEQDGTPTPAAPVDLVCNNGALVMVDDELPTGYRRVLGFSMNNNAYWEIEEFPLYGSDTLRFAFEATDACNVIGAYSGSASGNNYSLYVSTSSNYLRYKSGAYNSAINFDTRYDVEITPTGSSGMKTDSSWTAQTFTTPTNLCIGTTATSASSAKLKGKLYGNIEVVGRAKFVPCERVSDNALGYYDTIGGTFYEQASGYSGAVSLGYDGSHYHLEVVGTPEVVSIAPVGSSSQSGTPAPDNYVPVVGTKCGDTTLYAIGSNRDTYDPATQTITRYIGSHTFTGEESFTSSTAYGKALLVNAAAVSWGADRSESVLCNYFASGSAVSSAPAGTCFFNSTGHFYFRTDDSATDFKAWLASKAAAGTPIVVYFVKSTPTTESYTGAPIGTTASAPDLYAVGNYADEIDIISGNIIRRCGITVIDGSESGWALSDSGTTHRFRGIKPSDARTPSGRAPIASTHFVYIGTGQALGGAFIGASQYWYFIPTDQTIDTPEKWTAWLKQNPVIVIYPLDEEVAEQYTPQPITLSAGDNVITVTAEVDNIPLEATYIKAI